MGDDIHWRDIGGKDDNTWGLSDAGTDWRLSKRLDDFLDTTLESLVLGSWRKYLALILVKPQ